MSGLPRLSRNCRNRLGRKFTRYTAVSDTAWKIIATACPIGVFDEGSSALNPIDGYGEEEERISTDEVAGMQLRHGDIPKY